MSGRKNERNEDETLGEILADLVDRRLLGESPTVDDYAAQHPELREAIAGHLEIMDLLAGAREAKEAAHSPNDLAAAVAELPEASQKLIYLRHIERVPWPEVARRMEEPEEDLRRRHAADLRWLIERCRGWLEDSLKE